MLGAGLTTLAEDYGLSIENDWVFGEYNGYDIAIHQGASYKVAVVYGWFNSQAQISAINDARDGHDLKQEFCVTECELEAEGLHFTYYDKPEKQTDITPFLDWMTGLMKEQDVLGSEYCSCCGEMLSEKQTWMRIPKMNVPVHLHTACIKKSKAREMVERGLKREVKLTERNDLMKGKSKKKDYSLIFIIALIMISIIYREFIM